jgi:hypothetical protein
MLGFSGCKNAPDDVIYNTKTEEAGWVVEKKGDKPTMSYDAYYQISPTWGQSVHYAKKSSGFGFVITLGVILLFAAGVLFYAKSTDASWLPESIDNKAIYIIFVLVIAGFYAVYSKPGDVKWNNDKWVKKEVYDKAIKEAGSTQPIWDSLENNCLIIGGPCK